MLIRAPRRARIFSGSSVREVHAVEHDLAALDQPEVIRPEDGAR